DSGLFVVGLDAAGGTSVRDLEVADGPLVMVVGSEGRGLSRLVSQRCDLLARIPMVDETESLSAGVAAGVTLYEVAARRAASARLSYPAPPCRFAAPRRGGQASAMVRYVNIREGDGAAEPRAPMSGEGAAPRSARGAAGSRAAGDADGDRPTGAARRTDCVQSLDRGLAVIRCFSSEHPSL